MIARKKRKIIIISSIIAVILVIIGICITLYFTTDSFKSNKRLFGKYVSKNIGNINSLLEIIDKENNNDKKSHNKYTSAFNAKANYIENFETTSENTSNSINKLRLNLLGKTDNDNNYNYQEIKLYNDADEIIKAEYINDNGQYGIKEKDISDKYILSKDANLNDILKALGYTDEQILGLVQNLIQTRMIEKIEFTDDEKEILENKYLGVLNSNISDEKFSKMSNQNISIEGHSYNTTAYTLTLTTEELNNLYIKILEEMKNDEIIISKLEKLKPIINIIYKDGQEKEIKERFISLIDNKINEITKNNIGQEETKIIVYNYDKETIKTVITTKDTEISLECSNLKDNNYIKLSKKLLNDDKEMNIIVKQQGNSLKININQDSDEEKEAYSLDAEVNVNEDDKSLKKEYGIELVSNKKKFQVTLDEDLQVVNDFENQEHISDNNSVDLRSIENEEYNKIIEQTKNKTNKINELIKSDDIFKVLTFSKLMNERTEIKETGVTENERNRFNSRIELFVGENVEGSKVSELINIIRDNLINYAVENNKILKLELKQDEKDEKKGEIITEYISNNLNKKYDVNLEYDNETGFVKIINLTLKDDR